MIAAAGRVEAIPKVRALAESSQAPLAIRQAALEALGQIPSKDAASALAALTQPPRGAIAAAAARALGQQVPLWMQGPGTKTALQALETIVLANDADDAVREAAITTLAETQPGARWLLDRQANHELPADLVSQIGRLLRNSPHQDVHSRAWELFPVRKLDPAKLPDIAELARRRGNAAHGKEILAASVRSDLQCLKCHTIRGQGGNVGPDLSVIGKKASRENLFESILLPNKAIADQYVTWVVTTQRGQTLSGLLVEETPDHITLRDANAKDTRIARKEIDSKEKSPNSLMPSNLLVYMSEEDLVDIVEYLFGLRD